MLSNYDGKEIIVIAVPVGGSQGYHSHDPKWRETNATDWGMKFVSAQFGSTLVISSVNETTYIHHHYVLADIEIKVPPHIQVVLMPRAPTGDGTPDLSKP